MKKRNSNRIEICGGIASGKTSLAKILARTGLRAILEQFRKNPFYEAFYSNPSKYAFEAELSFLLQHYHQIKLDPARNKQQCCDFSFVLDCAYAHVTLKGGSLTSFMSVFDRIQVELPNRTILVRLVCDPNIELERIRNRGRTAESTISIDYLRSLDQCLTNQIATLPGGQRVVEIDSGAIDFVHDYASRRRVVQSIMDMVPT